MKYITAVKDRFENLGSPQTPCPLVQPLPNLVPNPTRKPAIAEPKKPIFESVSAVSKAGLAPSIIGLKLDRVHQYPYALNIIEELRTTADMRESFQKKLWRSAVISE